MHDLRIVRQESASFFVDLPRDQVYGGVQVVEQPLKIPDCNSINTNSTLPHKAVTLTYITPPAFPQPCSSPGSNREWRRGARQGAGKDKSVYSNIVGKL